MIHNLCNAQILLAQTGAGATGVKAANPSLLELARVLKGQLDILCHPDALVGPLTDLHLIWAAVFVFLGGLSVLNGYRWHKTLVVLLAALGGVTAGMAVGPMIGIHPAISGAATAALIAVVALPMMRYTAAALSGLAGAFLGANAWTAITLDPSQHLFGAVIGLIAFGMLAFLAFRVSIITFTSVLGAVLLTVGVLSALLKINDMRPGLAAALTGSPRILPIITGVVAVIGFSLQHVGGFKGLSDAADNADPTKKKTHQAVPQSG